MENINLSEVGIPVANHCYIGMQAQCYQFFFFFLRNARNKDLYKKEFYMQHSPKLKKKKKESRILNVGM